MPRSLGRTAKKFDYIHSRDLLFCFPDPAQTIVEDYNALSPEGIVEIQDPQMPIIYVDNSMDGGPIAKWAAEVSRAAERLERPVTHSRHDGGGCGRRGFLDVVQKHFYLPLNPWPRGKEKLIGLWAQQNLLVGIDAMSMALLTRGLRWSRGEVEVLLARVRYDLKYRAVHSYVDVMMSHPGDRQVVENNSLEGRDH